MSATEVVTPSHFSDVHSSTREIVVDDHYVVLSINSSR